MLRVDHEKWTNFEYIHPKCVCANSPEFKKDQIPSFSWTRGLNGKFFTTTQKKNGFYDNSDACEGAGGHLATILNLNDQEAVNDIIKKFNKQDDQFLWIGKQ